MNKKVLFAVIAAILLAVACIGLATVDSCKRLNRPCFGGSQNK